MTSLPLQGAGHHLWTPVTRSARDSRAASAFDALREPGASVDGGVHNVLIRGPGRVRVATARLRLFLLLLLASQEAPNDWDRTGGAAARVEAIENAERQEEPRPPRPTGLPAAKVPVVQVARRALARLLFVVAPVLVARGARVAAARRVPQRLGGCLRLRRPDRGQRRYGRDEKHLSLRTLSHQRSV